MSGDISSIGISGEISNFARKEETRYHSFSSINLKIGRIRPLMKKMFFTVILGLLAFVLFFYLLPLYKDAVKITRIKEKLNIISSTTEQVKFNLKPELYAGNGSIIPPNTIGVVGAASLDVDLSDRLLIRFIPESQFKIDLNSDKTYSITLISGGFAFKKSGPGSLKEIIAPIGKIILKGTKGIVTKNSIAISEGSATLNNYEIKTGEVFSGGHKKRLNRPQMKEISVEIEKIKSSKHKNVFANMLEFLPKFEAEINSNSKIAENPALDTSVKEEPSKAQPSKKGFIKDLFLGKTKVYCDMYLLRMAISHDRYFDPNMHFPPSLANLSDEHARARTIDPWGTPYKYTVESNDYFDLRSSGPDKILGTQDDIILFDKKAKTGFWQL